MDGFRQLTSMEWDDDQKLDHMGGTAAAEPPDYPPGLRFTVREADFEALDLAADIVPGTTTRFAALARCTSVDKSLSAGCRIECEIDLLALGDGKMAELDPVCRPSLCLSDDELDRLDVDDGCEKGDMLHLVGTVRVERAADTQWCGRCVELQIVEAAVEDEDQEG